MGMTWGRASRCEEGPAGERKGADGDYWLATRAGAGGGEFSGGSGAVALSGDEVERPWRKADGGTGKA